MCLAYRMLLHDRRGHHGRAFRLLWRPCSFRQLQRGYRANAPARSVAESHGDAGRRWFNAREGAIPRSIGLCARESFEAGNGEQAQARGKPRDEGLVHLQPDRRDGESCLGLAASVVSMASFVPQVLKVWRDDDNRGLSRRMYILTALGFALWISYGIVRGDAPIIIANFVCLVLSVAILVRLLLWNVSAAATARR